MTVGGTAVSARDKDVINVTHITVDFFIHYFIPAIMFHR